MITPWRTNLKAKGRIVHSYLGPTFGILSQALTNLEYISRATSFLMASKYCASLASVDALFTKRALARSALRMNVLLAPWLSGMFVAPRPLAIIFDASINAEICLTSRSSSISRNLSCSCFDIFEINVRVSSGL